MIKNYKDFTILHAEDDICDVRMMQRILTKMQYQGEYHQLTIGDQILPWMNDVKRRKLPDLLILDISLPGANGIELLELLRKEERTMGVPIIMMSGSNSLRDYHKCIALGANAYIQKTVEIAQLELIAQCFIEGFVHQTSQRFI
jgi:CheY-like chemotaxis protein